jgi:hypothetical protein
MLGKHAGLTVPSRDPGFSARDALLGAAVGVVEAAGTPAVTMSEVASAARVEVDEASGLFPSVDDMLVEAALRMCADDLRLDATTGAPTVSAYALHFARRRVFYRAMRNGAVAERLDARMARLVAPLITLQIRTLVGAHLTEDAIAQLTADVTAESFEVTNSWIVGTGDAEGAESLYRRLEAIVVRRLDDARRLGGEN